jgi:flagellar biosynthetic protein FlhB
MAVTVVLANYAPDAFGVWFAKMMALVYHAGTLRLQGDGLAHILVADLAATLWMPMAAAAIAGAGAILLQTRLLLHFGAVSPNVGRISPAAGLRRLFGTTGLVEVLRSTGKLLALGVALYLMVKHDVAGIGLLPSQAPQELPQVVLNDTLHILYVAIGIQAVIAAADLLWVRFKSAQDLRMTKQDIRDEFKEVEGNPQMKARVRRIGFSRARKRMMSRVPTATVVITNPTHYAVALTYSRGTNTAPTVVAKGVDHVAAKIRQLAQQASVPIVSNPPLARALYQLELDTEIPAEHFRAVAQIIAYVWRLRSDRPGLVGTR